MYNFQNFNAVHFFLKINYCIHLLCVYACGFVHACHSLRVEDNLWEQIKLMLNIVYYIIN